MIAVQCSLTPGERSRVNWTELQESELTLHSLHWKLLCLITFHLAAIIHRDSLSVLWYTSHSTPKCGSSPLGEAEKVFSHPAIWRQSLWSNSVADIYDINTYCSLANRNNRKTVLQSEWMLADRGVWTFLYQSIEGWINLWDKHKNYIIYKRQTSCL